MAGPGDIYRLKAADMLVRAEEHELFRQEFEKLAKAFLRLADHADRQLGLPLEWDDAAAQQSQQSSATSQEQPQQQQQQVQPTDKPTE